MKIKPIRENENKAKKLCYSYRRYSSKNQDNNSSIERQYDLAVKVAQEKGWTLIDLPADEGVSAFKIEGSDAELAANMHKGNLGSFLKRVERKEIPVGSVLIVERLDRFSRNYWDIVIQVWIQLMQSGIEIYSCVSQTHYTLTEIRRNPMLGSMALMEFANANEYSSGMSKRIASAFAIRLAACKEGKKFNLGGWVPKWLDFIGEEKQPGVYKINRHFNTIQRICLEYIQGNSMYVIARKLIADKIPTVMGGKWSQGTIANLLKHPALTGTLIIKGLTVPHFYPPVLTQSQHNKLQSMLRQNRERKGGDGANTDYIANLFRNRCKCYYCGETISTSKSWTQRLYTCKGKRVGKCKSKYSIRVSDLEMDFFMNYLHKSPDEILRTNTTEQSEKVTALQSKLAKLDGSIQEVVNLISKLPIEELQSKLITMQSQRQETRIELTTLSNAVIGSQNVPQSLQLLKDILGMPKTTDWENQTNQDIGKEIFNRIKQPLIMLNKLNAYKQSINKSIALALTNNETRKRILIILPSIIKGLIIDTTHKRYSVVNHSGQVSPFRNLRSK